MKTEKLLRELQQISNDLLQLQAELDEIRQRKDEEEDGVTERTKTPKDLVRNVNNNTKTTDLLDEFEAIGKYKDKEPYERLIVNGYYHGHHSGKLGFISIKYIIKRMKFEDEVIGDVTFTKLKTGKCEELHKYVITQIEDKVKSLSHDEKIEIELDVPYLLRAQNSRNREGYGWDWDWSYGIGSYTEGTYYGETTKYGIVGVQVQTFY